MDYSLGGTGMTLHDFISGVTGWDLFVMFLVTVFFCWIIRALMGRS